MYWLLFFAAFYAFADISLTLKMSPVHLTTSIIVPCAPKHFQYVPELLRAYAMQTRLPDEIVISLSEAIPLRSEIDHVQEQPWPFDLQILEHSERRSEGENRNLGALRATADLFLFQDADDIPHPQRVEWVARLFETYEIDHLIHAYVLDSHFHGFPNYTAGDLTAYYSEKLTNCVGDRHFHNGATAMKREVASQVKWVEGFVISTDTLTNVEVYKSVEKKVFLLEPLILYRSTFSTYHGNNR